ncbi:MAG: hypothetical protein ACRCYU_11170 [Nocardioides sp.]
MTQTSSGELKHVFFISPIGEERSPEREHADMVRKYLVEKALDSRDYTVERADDDTNPGNITPRIIAAIQNADLVLADLTGLNPNVFYELAAAHGYGKPVVLIFKKGERIPFDLKDVRVVRYDMTHPPTVDEAQTLLASFAKAALDNPEAIQTPLSDAGRFRALEESTDPQVDALVALTEQIQSLRRAVSALLSETEPRRSNRQKVRSVVAEVLQELETRQASPPKAADPWATGPQDDPWATTGSQTQKHSDPWATPTPTEETDS